MERFHRTNYARLGLGGIVLAALIALGVSQPQPSLPSLGMSVLAVIGTAALVNFPLALRRRAITLAHLIGLGSALMGEAIPAAALSGLGVILGDTIRFTAIRSPGFRNVPTLERAGLTAFDFAQVVATTLSAGFYYRVMGGPLPATQATAAHWVALLSFGLAALVAYNAMTIVELWLSGENWPDFYRDNLAALAVVNFVPLPLAVYTTSSPFSLSVPGVAVQLAVFVAIAVTLNSLSRTWLYSQARIAELNSLNKVSRAMRASLDLNALLDTIYLQTAHLLNVANFYIALYDADGDTISFSLAIKEGVRQKWESRQATNRLTDWIIRNRAPLLIPYDVPGTLVRLGLERGDVEPEAFMGAPLVSSDRVLGCMAVLSFTPGETFTEQNLEIFTTLTSQAAVAIENAQLYGVTQRRAAELATLARLATLVSATLDPAQVLQLVCSSLLPLVHGDKAAIFLLEEAQEELYLARSEGLSEEYLRQSLTIPLSNEHRARAVTSGLPVTVGDVLAGSQPQEVVALAEAEGFRAYAELPLAAQRETIGLLAVYFASPHHFKAAELELLKTFANQAALAVANARQYARTDQALARRVAQLSALEAIGRELTATLDLSRVFDVVLARAMEATDAAAASLTLYNDQTAQAEVRAATGYPADFIGNLGAHNLANFPGITGRVLRLGQAALVPDVTLDSDYHPGAPGTRSQLSVPVVRQGRVVGVISLESPRPAAFTQEDVRFVTQMAAQAGLAIENAQLFLRVAEGRDQLAAVLNSTSEGFLMVDMHGQIALANPKFEEFFGIPRRALVGRTLAELTAAPSLWLGTRLGYTDEQLEDLAKSAAKTQVAVSAPAPRIVERTGLPVTDEQGTPVGWLIVVRDISEEKELERAREDLANMIVHDLRSPLTAILGSIELIKDMLPAREKQGVVDQALQVSARSCCRLLGLVESLLDISKIESGELVLNLRAEPLKPLVADVVADLAALASEHDVALLDEVPPDAPPLAIDHDKVVRVLTNLVDNALKFTPPGGRVAIQAELNDDQPHAGPRFVTCRVSDTGPGIPEDYRERIFDRFVQVPGLGGHRRGAGLGLTFCKMTVEAHGGRIWVANRPEGGSVFSFTLPVANE